MNRNRSLKYLSASVSSQSEDAAPVERIPERNPLRIDGKKISRNAVCVCGSGKKSKRCCLR